MRDPTATLSAVLPKIRTLMADELVRVDEEIAAVEAALSEAGCQVAVWVHLAEDTPVAPPTPAGGLRVHVARLEIGWDHVGQDPDTWALCRRRSVIAVGDIEQVLEEGTADPLCAASVDERVLGARRIPALLGALDQELNRLIAHAQGKLEPML